MFGTFLGVLGVGASFAGLYKGQSAHTSTQLRLDEIDVAISKLTSVINERIIHSTNSATQKAWGNEAEEIAFRLYNELKTLSDNLSLPVYIEVVNGAQEHSHIHKNSTGRIDSRAIRIAFPDTPIDLGADYSGFLHQLHRVADRRGRQKFENLAPVFLQTPSVIIEGQSEWEKKLHSIAPEQEEEKSILIDKRYWEERLEKIES